MANSTVRRNHEHLRPDSSGNDTNDGDDDLDLHSEDGEEHSENTPAAAAPNMQAAAAPASTSATNTAVAHQQLITRPLGDQEVRPQDPQLC